MAFFSSFIMILIIILLIHSQNFLFFLLLLISILILSWSAWHFATRPILIRSFTNFYLHPYLRSIFCHNFLSDNRCNIFVFQCFLSVYFSKYEIQNWRMWVTLFEVLLYFLNPYKFNKNISIKLLNLTDTNNKAY